MLGLKPSSTFCIGFLLQLEKNKAFKFPSRNEGEALESKVKDAGGI